MADPLKITAQGLACQRGVRLLFSDLSFTLDAGAFLQLTGANGSGKSSLLRILAGLLPADAGAISLDEGRETYPSLALHAHYLGHENALKTALTVRENLSFWQGMGEEAGLSPDDAVAKVALPHLIDLPVQVLSAGQKRRIAFARLLVSKRPVWLLDEPTAALDKASDALVGSIITDHARAGGIVIAATHLPLAIDLAENQRHALDVEEFAPKEQSAEGLF